MPSHELVKIEWGHADILQENLESLQNEDAWYGYTPLLD